MRMLEQGWKFLVVQGVVAIVFGIIAMVWPIGTALALVVMWGIFALVDGIAAFIGAFQVEGGGRKTFYVVMGIVSIIAGIIAVTEPLYAAVALTWVLGIWLIVRAAFEAYAAFTVEEGGMRWLRVLGGVFFLVAGIIFVSRPAASAVGLALWLGFFALLAGIMFVVTGLVARSVLRKAQAGGLPA
jgi:uncharacterized membrane protein HdeD (DUF308 family)